MAEELKNLIMLGSTAELSKSRDDEDIEILSEEPLTLFKKVAKTPSPKSIKK